MGADSAAEFRSAALTVGDAAKAGGELEAHVRLVRSWASDVWRCWAPHHGAIRAIAKDLQEVSR